MSRFSGVFYIKNLITGTTVNFELLPDGISEGVSANFDEQTVHGASRPFFGYDSTGARTISFSAVIHADYSEKSITSVVNQLKALTYPQYDGGIVTPPICFLRLADMVATKVIVNSVSVSWSGAITERTAKSNSYKYTGFDMAEVSLDCTECTGVSYSAKNIEAGSNFNTGWGVSR